MKQQIRPIFATVREGNNAKNQSEKHCGKATEAPEENAGSSLSQPKFNFKSREEQL